MKCKKHKDVDSTKICAACGLPKCEECLVDVLDDHVCRSCLKKGKVGAYLQPKISNGNEWSPKESRKIVCFCYALLIVMYCITR